ncbi:hypothetical protein BDZ89DRAFT_1079174 [Hymenopellis radicata]|nr:hypothetical protein BDZ89DRAFT_1079174 [Hymenopellis radicata]
MNNPLLLPELVDCALVSRAWSSPASAPSSTTSPCSHFFRASDLLHHLLRYPHLQNLILRINIWQTPTQPGQSNYLSCLIALFTAPPSFNLSLCHIRHSLEIWITHELQFIEALGAFLHTSQSLTKLAVYGLQDEAGVQQMFSYLEGTNVKHVSLNTEPFLPDDPLQALFLNSKLSIVHLPAIERLDFNLADVPKLHPALNFWLGQHPAMFPNLQHCEFVVNQPLDLGILFRDVLPPVALELESFRLELMLHILEELPIHEGLFDGLHFKHFKLCISERGIGRDEMRSYINWLSSMLRHLADSRTTVHFVDLTFTFVEAVGVDFSAEWATLDEVLSHAAFNGVQRIHFEQASDKRGAIARALITDQWESELASVLRRTLPHLANRGVLCFESGGWESLSQSRF